MELPCARRIAATSSSSPTPPLKGDKGDRETRKCCNVDAIFASAHARSLRAFQDLLPPTGQLDIPRRQG